MRFRPFPILGLCLASGAFVVGVSAQPPKAPARKAPVAPRADETGAVIVTGNTSLTDTATSISKLTGNVVVTQVGEDVSLHSDSLIYNDPQKRAIATVNLVVTTRDSTIRGDRVDANFNTKMLTMTGQVRISTHGKGDGITGNRAGGGIRDEFASKPSKLKCDRVDWDYETREAVLTGHIKMTQGKNSGTCDRIEFDERQNVARLKNHVEFTDDKGQSYKTPDLTIYNDENRIVTGQSTLHFKPNAGANAASRAPKPPVPVKKPPVITDDEAAAFGIKRAPIPVLKPEPTPTPEPEPAPEPPDDAAPAG